jgi:hypothetical protein
MPGVAWARGKADGVALNRGSMAGSRWALTAYAQVFNNP